MQKRDKIIDEIIKSLIIEKVSNSILFYLSGTKDDFIQEMFLIILEMPEDRLIKLYDKGELYFYIVKIIKNLGLSIKSSYNKKYKQTNTVGIEYLENLPYEE